METGKRKYEISTEMLAIRNEKISEGVTKYGNTKGIKKKPYVMGIRISQELMDYVKDNNLTAISFFDMILDGSIDIETVRKLQK